MEIGSKKERFSSNKNLFFRLKQQKYSLPNYLVGEKCNKNSFLIILSQTFETTPTEKLFLETLDLPVFKGIRSFFTNFL